MNHCFSIQYADISLIPITEEYSEYYRVLRNKPEIGRWFTYKNYIDKKQQSKWFSNYLVNPDDIMFAILDLSGRFIGGNSIYNIDKIGAAEYGRLIIDPICAGNGYGLKATYAAALIAKQQVGINTLRLEVYENNYAAITTYKKVGYQETGQVTDANGSLMKKMVLNLKDFYGR